MKPRRNGLNLDVPNTQMLFMLRSVDNPNTGAQFRKNKKDMPVN